MDIQYQEFHTGGSTTTINIPQRSGYQEGDLHILFTTRDLSAANNPSGYTSTVLTSNNVGGRVCGEWVGSDGLTTAATFASGQEQAVSEFIIRGADPAASISANKWQGLTSSNPAIRNNTDALTPYFAFGLCGFDGADNPITNSTGMFLRSDPYEQLRIGSSGSGHMQYLCWKADAQTGDFDSTTLIGSGVSDGYVTVPIKIQAGAAGVGFDKDGIASGDIGSIDTIDSGDIGSYDGIDT